MNVRNRLWDIKQFKPCLLALIESSLKKAADQLFHLIFWLLVNKLNSLWGQHSVIPRISIVMFKHNFNYVVNFHIDTVLYNGWKQLNSTIICLLFIKELPLTIIWLMRQQLHRVLQLELLEQMK